jgi:hypothetical protein
MMGVTFIVLLLCGGAVMVTAIVAAVYFYLRERDG